MKKAIFDTDRGTIEVELFPEAAPKAVANFEKLCAEGFYDGCSFHRVISNFMVQGGDPLSKSLAPGDRRIGTGGPGYTIKCETKGNPHKHQAGTLSMAHAGRDTGGSQFFITHAPQPHLDGVHTVFGQVTGPAQLDVVFAIRQGDRMKSVRVVES